MIWQCALRIRNPHSGIEAWLYGYGTTAEKALSDAKDTAQYRKEKEVAGVKPVLRHIDDESVTRVLSTLENAK